MSSTYDVQRVRGVLLFSTAVLHLCFFLNTITRKTFYSTHKLHMNILHSTRERFFFLLRKAGDTTYLADGLHVGQSMLLPVLLLNVSEAWGC